MNNTINLAFNPNKPLHEVSSNLYGIFLEDLNFACDGGLNANMVNNYSFDGVYFDNIKKKPVYDYLRYWSIEKGSITSSEDRALSRNSRYARILANGKCQLSNLGYNNLKKEIHECAMAIKETEEYLFECYIRNIDFKGSILVGVCDKANKMLTDMFVLDSLPEEWLKVESSLLGKSTGYGKLVITFDGSGTLDLDCISLMNRDAWNKGNAKWTHGKMRKDLVQTLSDLKPSFMRFPGGCIVEGKQAGNEYNWKDTVGPLYDRKQNYNLWSEKIENGGYSQSYQIGFYEYFCLCEDIGAKPLPTLFAGINCQLRTKEKIDINSAEFQDYVVQNYLDLIEFANGNPDTNEWAALRRNMGHPESFHLELIGVGNENYGKDYLKRFKIIKGAINSKYPNIKCILSAGFLPHNFAIKGAWKVAKNDYKDVLVDEHSYHSPKWFYKAEKRFDKYKRGTAKVYFGEYSANGLFAGKKMNNDNTNLFESAISEAAFLTGVERNSDIVEMTSYAPLFNMVGCDQWLHNMVDFNPFNTSLSVNYLVQKMFSSHIGDLYIPYTGNLQKNIYVSATADENSLYIKMVNANPKEYQASIIIEAVHNQNVMAEMLQSDNLMVKNWMEFRGGPKYNIEIENVNYEIKDGLMKITLKPYSICVLTVVRHKS